MEKILSIILLLIFTSCSSNETENSIQGKTIYENGVTKGNQIEKVDKTETIKKMKSGEGLNSLLGLRIGEYYASDENEYSFCPNNNLIISYSSRLFMIGKWEIINDTIWMNLEEQYQKIGIGNPIPSPEVIPNNYIEEYEDYKEEISEINKREYLVFSEIRALIKEDEKYPYEILERNLKCDITTLKIF